MRVAVRVVELCGPPQIPTGLKDYDGVRIYYSIRGQIKGYTTIWNCHSSFLKRKFHFSTDFPAWLRLSNALFSPLGSEHANPYLVKATLCAKIGVPYDEMDEAYKPETDFELPPLSASIVIPTRDRPKDLARALSHLAKHQTRVPHEIIVVDNNPASGLTPPVVANFPEVIYVAEKRPGVGYARNTGALAARGDLIITTDDDVAVDEGWLDHLVAPFTDPKVGAVMGLVLPYEISSRSQELFEEMGGLNLGFEERRFGAEFIHTPSLPDLGQVGNTSSAAFRFSMFADPKVGPFEVSLGSGTPTRGGGDIYHFYRVLMSGMESVYQPKARAFHKHRTSMAKLRKQLISFESGHIGMLLTAATRDKDERAYKVLRSSLPRYQWGRLREALGGHSPIPLDLILTRIWGNLIGPINFWRAVRWSRKLGDFTPEQFARQLATRESLTSEVARVN